MSFSASSLFFHAAGTGPFVKRLECATAGSRAGSPPCTIPKAARRSRRRFLGIHFLLWSGHVSTWAKPRPCRCSRFRYQFCMVRRVLWLLKPAATCTHPNGRTRQDLPDDALRMRFVRRKSDRGSSAPTCYGPYQPRHKKNRRYGARHWLPSRLPIFCLTICTAACSSSTSARYAEREMTLLFSARNNSYCSASSGRTQTDNCLVRFSLRMGINTPAARDSRRVTVSAPGREEDLCERANGRGRWIN